jgi:hypothetical protein
VLVSERNDAGLQKPSSLVCLPKCHVLNCEQRSLLCTVLLPSKDWQWVATWAGRFSWRGRPRRSEANRNVGDCLVLTLPSSLVLAVLLVIGGVEQNPGPVAGGQMTMQLLRTGCDRNLKSGIQCELCGRSYHYTCGNVKVPVAQ